VTLDADFHALLALSAVREPSVIRLRIEGLRAEEFCRLLQRVLQQCSEDLASGALISVTESQIRIRRLPIG
jgi:predicted nuclease of predicted toxin-antitoxin system